MKIAFLLSAIANLIVTAVGSGWMCTLFAALSVFAMGLMILLKTHGPQIRQFSEYQIIPVLIATLSLHTL
jgi:hypothetical protein